MATYPIEHLITEYGNARMDVEMITGHALQHLRQVHGEIKTANQRRQKLRDQLNLLEARVAQTEARTENQLTALSLTVHQLKAVVDSLLVADAADSAKN